MLLGVSNGYRIKSEPSPIKIIFPLIWVSCWVLQGCPVHDSCSNYFGGRKTKEETKTLIPQTDHCWWCKLAWQGAVTWSNEADLITCQSFETFGIDLLFGCCQKSFTSGKRPKDPKHSAKKEGENQKNWALNDSVGALKVLFSSLSIKRKQKSSACQSICG